MTKWTKADIDGLVDNAPAAHERWIRSFQQDVRTQLYLAAGLTAEGEPKPEKVRCWMFPDYYSDGWPMIMVEHKGCTAPIPFIPGTFIPDGAA